MDRSQQPGRDGVCFNNKPARVSGLNWIVEGDYFFSSALASATTSAGAAVATSSTHSMMAF